MLGAKGTRRAREAGQSGLLPRLGWLLATCWLIVSIVGFVYGLVNGVLQGLHEAFTFDNFV